MRTALGRVPAWVTDGWYANNPFAQQHAITRFHMPVTGAQEREAARAFVPETTMPCAGCGRFAFTRPTICYWCTTEMGTA